EIPETETMLTILPHLLWSIPRTTALVIRKAPFRSTSSTSSQSSSLRNGKSASLMIPALLTRMSAPPKSFDNRSPTALTAAASRTSAAIACASPPRERISAAAASALSRSVRQVMTTRCPTAPSATEIARPMPRELPVTRAVLMKGVDSRQSTVASHVAGVPSAGNPTRVAEYTRHLADGRERPGGSAGHRPVDPARHLREHVARADLQERALADADHRLDRRVPEGRVEKLRAEETADVRGVPRPGAVPTVGGGHRVPDRPAGLDDPRHRARGRRHQLAVNRPVHPEGKDPQR